jgi:hypothetical protein
MHVTSLHSRLLKYAAAVLLTPLCFGHAALAADPYAANNGFYPDPATKAWQGPYRTQSYDYPATPVDNGWFKVAPRQRLTVATAPRYVTQLKAFVAPALRGMIETPDRWKPSDVRWYDMPWMGEGDAENGRDSILGSFSGQVVLQKTFADSGLTVDMQNHTVVYYDVTAAATLRKLWADPFNPDRRSVSFPEGSMIIKGVGVTPTPQEWPVVEGASVWNVYRPPVAEVIKYKQDPSTPLHPVVTPLRVLQFDIIVKDSVASPQTGWVFTTFVYDRLAPGKGTWDKLVPLGAIWGNDPQFAREPDGRDPKGGELRETWINKSAPKFAFQTLGWGGRLSGPIDVSERHDVLLTNGQLRPKLTASSCLSCHGTAQFPFVANLYPSPNKTFPPEGSLFPMFPPGSEEWARWFQNRPGTEPQNKNKGSVALDYDMLIMFALSSFDAAAGNDQYVQQRFRVH